MKIDMHTHCLPASLCAHHEPELLPGYFRKKGIDAIVLTNHYVPSHCKKLGTTPEEQALGYIDVYKRCKKEGEKVGIKVFFGAELKLTTLPTHPEFLLYGMSEEDFIFSFPLFHKTQEEVFEFCNEKNILMVQSHPYRTEQGYEPADMRYVHGIEVYNPHLLFDARFDDALKLAVDNNKIKTSGSDFHIKDQAGLAGMIVPDYIEDQFMLRDYLKENKAVIFDKSGILFEG